MISSVKVLYIDNLNLTLVKANTTDSCWKSCHHVHINVRKLLGRGKNVDTTMLVVILSPIRNSSELKSVSRSRTYLGWTFEPLSAVRYWKNILLKIGLLALKSKAYSKELQFCQWSNFGMILRVLQVWANWTNQQCSVISVEFVFRRRKMWMVITLETENNIFTCQGIEDLQEICAVLVWGSLLGQLYIMAGPRRLRLVIRMVSSSNLCTSLKSMETWNSKVEN